MSDTTVIASLRERRPLRLIDARVISELASARGFCGTLAVFFIASAAATIVWCRSMAAMGMPMCGGVTLSAAWMRLPGETWAGAATSFLGLWEVMMAAMMLPPLAPMLWRYHRAIGRTGETRLARFTVLVGLGYFTLWALVGMAAFALGAALTALEMQRPALAQATPIAAAAGVVVLIAGAVQLTPWKAHHLACCRGTPRGIRAIPAEVGTAWRHGFRLGLQCGRCCGNLMAILLVGGAMDLGTMAAVTAAITLERLAPDGERAARAIGAVIVGVGVLRIAQAAGLG